MVDLYGFCRHLRAAPPALLGFQDPLHIATGARHRRTNFGRVEWNLRAGAAVRRLTIDSNRVPDEVVVFFHCYFDPTIPYDTDRVSVLVLA